MPKLVALDATGDPSFAGRLVRIWDAGNAAFPVDPRLPAAARDAIEAAMRIGDEVEAGDALVVATSGSTGTPKGVVLTHDAVRASAALGTASLAVDPAVDRWLSCLPLSHLAALGVVTKAILTGTALTVLPAFDADRVEALARERPTLTTLVPTAYRRVDPSLFRAIVIGGAPVPGGLPANVVTSYGLTETCGGCVYNGRPFPGVEIRVGDGGEIALRGPVLLRAYRDGSDPKDAEGWLPTGDAGRLDDTGQLSIDGRLSDLIITGGENVWPAAVERVLRTHAAVHEAAVAGRPDPDWDERVAAWIVPADPAAPPTLDALRAHVKESLPPWCAPRELILVDALPLTPSGKVHRASLS
jgi:o-succinylbenzoate---CoA ligase